MLANIAAQALNHRTVLLGRLAVTLGLGFVTGLAMPAIEGAAAWRWSRGEVWSRAAAALLIYGAGSFRRFGAKPDKNLVDRQAAMPSS